MYTIRVLMISTGKYFKKEYRKKIQNYHQRSHDNLNEKYPKDICVRIKTKLILHERFFLFFFFFFFFFIYLFINTFL